MTRAVFCDLMGLDTKAHQNNNNLVKQENVGRLKISFYDEKRKVFRHIDGEACKAELNTIIALMKANGVDTEEDWYVEVLIPPNTGDFNKSAKRWKNAKLSIDEYDEYKDLRDDMRSEEQEETRYRKKHKKDKEDDD